MSQTKKKVAVFTGTRAEYGLLYWLLKDIKSDPELLLQLLVSGSHLSPAFGMTFEQIEQDGFDIAAKVEMLLSSDSAVGTAKSVGLGMIGLADALARLQPDVIVILGDRFEALAAAQTALFLRIPIIHLHGGEITEGAYDDSIRHAITKMSYLHGVSTDEHRNRVIQLGEAPERVENIGAIGLDHLTKSTFMSLSQLSSSLDFPLAKDFFIVTYHPETLGSESPEAAFQSLLDALDKFPSYQVIITYPNADDGGSGVIRMIEDYCKCNPERVLGIPSLGHIRYLSAVKHCAAVIGNSSSGIIEVPSFGVPTVNIGIRQKGRMSAPSVIHCESSLASISHAIEQALSQEFREKARDVQNPYGKGDSSARVIEMIKKLNGTAHKSFFDINVSRCE
ncbi:UDP-N-acetylglucosamine 2-epimerase [Alteromonas sp. D210916BOD_24]|uniref:UDP-N-acetylglucosamine 2-epimerase n=1 Tax=Alteromonas sp. D210916BOD_24 TaxID=3157618 RepID=UPI00399D3D41